MIITNYKRNQTILVAIDGVDASGKSSLANELKKVICDRPVVRMSIDGFYNPEATRTKKGFLSPIGYYEDSFNYTFLTENVFSKIKNGFSSIVPRIYDCRVESALNEESLFIPQNAVIIFDGVFLLRKELFDYWDLSIFLDVTFETVIGRAKKRDIDYFGDINLLLEKYEKRYIPGQMIYIQEESPKSKAELVIDNNDFENPEWIKKMGNAR